MQPTKTVITVGKITDHLVTNEAALVVIYGLNLGKKFNLNKSTVMIGRSPECDIQIDQESVSRTHAKIVNDGNTFIIQDLGSTNGTFVNDQLLDESLLNDGDFIKTGRTLFKFLLGGNIESAYHEEIYRLTTTDGLTQIYNKRYFMENLDREMRRSQRYGRDLSLFIYDIDHFKEINDTYGHLAGDYVLKEMSAEVAANIRREDFLARYGGEEFAIILPETDHKQATVLASKVREIIEYHSFVYAGKQISVTISIGVATVDADMSNMIDFIRKADYNLYQAKKMGRNRVVG